MQSEIEGISTGESPCDGNKCVRLGTLKSGLKAQCGKNKTILG